MEARQALERDAPELSVVIPVYRSAPGLPELHERLGKALRDISPDYEILFVDDVSPDDAWTVLERIGESDAHVRLLQVVENCGQQRAVLCGFAESRGKIVVTMDDDLQQRPEEIHLLVEALQRSEADAVIGSYQHKQHGAIRGLGTRLVKEVAFRTLGVPRSLDLTSFRALRGDIAREVSKRRNPNPVVGFLLFQVTQRIASVPVHHDARKHGSSGYGWRDLAEYFLSMLVDYAGPRLRAASIFGSALAALVCGLGAFTLSRYMLARSAEAGLTGDVVLAAVSVLVFVLGLGVAGTVLSRLLRRGEELSVPAVRRRVG